MFTAVVFDFAEVVAEVFEVLEEEFVVAVAVVVLVDFAEELVAAEEVTEVEDVAEETVSDRSEEVSERGDSSAELVSVGG